MVWANAIMIQIQEVHPTELKMFWQIPCLETKGFRQVFQSDLNQWLMVCNKMSHKFPR